MPLRPHAHAHAHQAMPVLISEVANMLRLDLPSPVLAEAGANLATLYRNRYGREPEPYSYWDGKGGYCELYLCDSMELVVVALASVLEPSDEPVAKRARH